MSEEEFKKEWMERWLEANKREMLTGKRVLPPGEAWSFQEFMEDIAGIGYQEDLFDNAEKEETKEKIVDLMIYIKILIRMKLLISSIDKELIMKNSIFIESFSESIDLLQISLLSFYIKKYNLSVSILRNAIESSVNGAFFNYIFKNISDLDIRGLSNDLRKRMNRKNKAKIERLRKFLYEVNNVKYSFNNKNAIVCLYKINKHTSLPTIFNQEGLEVLEKDFVLTRPMNEELNSYVKYRELSKNTHVQILNIDRVRINFEKNKDFDEKEYFEQRLSEYENYFNRVTDSIATLFLNVFEKEIKENQTMNDGLNSIFEEELSGPYGVEIKYASKKIREILESF